MPVISTAKMTARQFLELGEDPVGVRLELVDGAIAISPSITPEHSHIDVTLCALVVRYVDDRALGIVFHDLNTIFGEHDVRRPDLLYVSRHKLDLIGAKAIEGPPDLCVEIVSPSSSTVDRVDKFEQYQAGGVAHYWVVDPRDRSIEGYKLRREKYVPTGAGRGDDIVRLPPFPKLPIPVGELWLPDFRNGHRRRR